MLFTGFGHRSLHHADCGQTWSDVKARLVRLLHRQVGLIKEQLINTLVHIEKMVETKQKHILSPQPE